jgi:hypothetical protein
VAIAVAVIAALGGIVAAYVSNQAKVGSARPEISPGANLPPSTETGRPTRSTFPSEPDKKTDLPLADPPKAGGVMRTGQYGLISINGVAQFGTEMRLTRLSDDHFTARAQSATGVVQTDLRRGTGSKWFVQLVDPSTGLGVGDAVANEVLAAGSRLTFSSRLGDYVWEWKGP